MYVISGTCRCLTLRGHKYCRYVKLHGPMDYGNCVNYGSYGKHVDCGNCGIHKIMDYRNVRYLRIR